MEIRQAFLGVKGVQGEEKFFIAFLAELAGSKPFEPKKTLGPRRMSHRLALPGNSVVFFRGQRGVRGGKFFYCISPQISQF